MVKFLAKGEQCGRWPPQTCTTMFFLIPKNVTSEHPVAFVPTLVRWWERLRAPRWQGRHRVGWDTTDGRIVWETVLEMERIDYCVGEEGQGASTLVLHLANAT